MRNFGQLLTLLMVLPVLAGPHTEHVTYIPLSEAKPVLESLAEAAPTELHNISPERLTPLHLVLG